ncbi:MAG: prephenate dehydratase [Prolixibacteraceae bacterium]|nr:prephenate dehydratase [Prolixibacteraceae bacterium]MBN2775040.1 prephenate dehydratase [Prolixibacteraceae bacterium]
MKKVAIQGIAGSFHEDAARRYFEEEIEIVECKSFRKVCELIDADKVDIAVMAIENSIAGSLLNNYGLIRDFHLRITGEIYIHIQLNLMALPGVEKKDIREVYSHPVSFQQCNEYLEQNFPGIKTKELGDNAGVAKYISEEKIDYAAVISNNRSAEIYGLNILETGIETNKKNYTRFLILAKHGNSTEGTNKASICFEVGHYYGSLAAVLNIFTEYKINLAKIQSVPIIGKPNEYTIHVDIEWDTLENYEHAIHQVLKKVSSLSILGEYNKGEVTIQANGNY